MFSMRIAMRRLQPREHIRREQRPVTVMPGIVRRVLPAVRGQILADLGLERLLVLNR